MLIIMKENDPGCIKSQISVLCGLYMEFNDNKYKLPALPFQYAYEWISPFEEVTSNNQVSDAFKHPSKGEVQWFANA